MKTLSFYEQVAILIPGAICLFALLLIIPELKSSFAAADGITVGGLGLFLILAYGTGHAVAAIGNLLESAFGWFFGGMPSDWVVKDGQHLIQPEQLKLLEDRITERLGFSSPALHGLPKKRWKAIFGQLYRHVLTTNPGRIETFNGNYGLNRGLSAALLAVTILVIIARPNHWIALAIGTAVLAGIYLIRMHRFGVHFAKEVLFCFLNPTPTVLPKKD